MSKAIPVVATRVILIVLSALLGACVSTVSVGELAALHKGMPAAEVAQGLRTEPEFVFQTTVNEQPYTVHMYLLSSGQYLSDYFLAYMDGRLIFWGYPHEFARSKDETLNVLGRKAVRDLEKQRAARRTAQASSHGDSP